MAGMWCVYVCPQGEGRNTDKVPLRLEWSGCDHECVREKCLLHGAWLCVIKTQRRHCGKMQTGIKMGIGICAQKHACSHSYTQCVTRAHTLLLICHSAHSHNTRCKLQH